MTWLEELHAELGRAGIRGRTGRRIELEFADHVACEPGCESRLGTPREVAQRFAAELRIVRTRRATSLSFAALVLAACGVLATLRSYSAVGSGPDVPGVQGWVIALTGIPILFAPQVAFVAGALGAIRGYHLRRGGSADGLALVQHRLWVGVVAAAVTAAFMLAQVVVLWGRMPDWWRAVALAAVVAPTAALAAAALALHRAGRVTSGDASAAEGLETDVPWFREIVARPLALLAVVGVPVCLVVFAGTAHAESSLLEGLERGVAEALAILAGFALLGRRLRIR
jgi:hypothetical protein